MTVTKNPFSEFLEREFTRIQFERGKRINISEFADLLGFSQSAISQWLNGERTPDKSSVIKLAQKLSPEIFDYFNIPRPDPDLQALIKIWDQLPEEARRALRTQGEKFADQNDKPAALTRSVEKTPWGHLSIGKYSPTPFFLKRPALVEPIFAFY